MIRICYMLMTVVLIFVLIVFVASIIKTIVDFIVKIVKNRDRKKEEEFFQRQYIDDNFKQQRDDMWDLRCKIANNLYRIENIEEKLNKKETKKNVKKKKRN